MQRLSGIPDNLILNMEFLRGYKEVNKITQEQQEKIFYVIFLNIILSYKPVHSLFQYLSKE